MIFDILVSQEDNEDRVFAHLSIKSFRDSVRKRNPDVSGKRPPATITKLNDTTYLEAMGTPAGWEAVIHTHQQEQ